MYVFKQQLTHEKCRKWQITGFLEIKSMGCHNVNGRIKSIDYMHQVKACMWLIQQHHDMFICIFWTIYNGNWLGMLGKWWMSFVVEKTKQYFHQLGTGGSKFCTAVDRLGRLVKQTPVQIVRSLALSAMVVECSWFIYLWSCFKLSSNQLLLFMHSFNHNDSQFITF